MSAYPIRDEKGRFRQARQVTNPRPLHLRNGGRLVRQGSPMYKRVPTIAPERTGQTVSAMMEENPYGRKSGVRLDWEERTYLQLEDAHMKR